jgi:hypothetical protein
MRASEKPEEDAALALNATHVNRRILALEELLEGGALNRQDEEAAREIISGYRKVLELLGSSSAAGSGEPSLMSEILFFELVRLEKLHFSSEGIAKGDSASSFTEYHRKRTFIRDQFLLRGYENVIRACNELEEDYGPQAISSDIGLFLALSLAETGRTTDAIRTGKRVLPELEGRYDTAYLHSRMISWYLKTGNREQAKSHYKKLVDSVNERNRHLKIAEKELRPVEEEKPAGPATSFKDISDKGLPGPLKEALQRVELLIAEGKFDDARILLVRQRIRYSKGSEAKAIDEAIERIDLTEESFGRKNTDGGNLAIEVSLDEIRRLIEREKFSIALKRLEKADPPDGYLSEVSELRDQATTGIIRRDRDEAAREFLKARNSDSKEEKKRFLVSSYKLLKNLISRFPNSHMVPKIRDNLDTVKMEMEKIGMNPKGYDE